ncbi:MAG TPA: hypothetical protein VMV92_13325 [Streptosporangiaceae bacterium]|nr:hypothetical protein [Streptosporangiaceae bacterium]
MSSLTVDQFAALVVDWSKRRNDQLKFNWPVKGGWEGWIQVDLTAFVLSVDSTADILREQPIYSSPGKRTDLLLNTTLDTDAQIPVEIKAESFENRGPGFVSGVLADLSKLNDERNTNYSESTCIMLAVPFSQESRDQVEAIEFDGHRIFVRIFQGEVACAIAVWTEVDGWLSPNSEVLAAHAVSAAARG